MTKRLVALLLSLIMLLGCLVGCGKKDDEIEDIANEGSEKTITLSMYLMSENKVSDEQALAIQNAVNKITKSKFKTQLILHYFSEENADDYYAALEDAYDEWLYADDEKDKNDEVLTGDAATETAEETYVDEYGVVQLKYPTIPDYQVDLFYISGYDTLSNYILDEMVVELSDEVDNSSKVLKSYVPSAYLKGVDAVCNGLYAIPTNAPIGEYTYMLLNKDILAEYNHTASDFPSIFCQEAQYLLDHVSKYNKDYVPFRSFTPENELDIANMGYVGINENGQFDSSLFSLAGSTCAPGQRPAVQRIFNDATFVSNLRVLSDYEGKGYYGTAADAQKDFAMGYIKGGLEVVEQYQDKYEVVVLEAPTLNTMDLFENMFAVSASTADTARSMEILTYLYTNKDFNNLLVYGIEGENYELVDSDMLDKNGLPYQHAKALNNKYVMSPEKLGNMLISYPTVNQPANLFEMYNKQNIDSIASSTLGMVADYDYLPTLDEETEYLRTESEKLLKKYFDEANSAELFDKYLAEVRNYIDLNTRLQKAMSTAPVVGEDEELFYTITGVYNYWSEATQQSSGSSD